MIFSNKISIIKKIYKQLFLYPQFGRITTVNIHLRYGQLKKEKNEKWISKFTTNTNCSFM